jgi:hypothetical protein
MTKPTTSALGSRNQILVCICVVLLTLPLNVGWASTQSWPYPWPDSSNLPAGATQSGNVFPGGNLWGGGTLYTPDHMPQRYLTWDFEDPWDCLPHIHGISDPGLASYRNSMGTFTLGRDRYNLDGIDNTWRVPTDLNDESVWELILYYASAGQNLVDGNAGNFTTVDEVPGNRMILFDIANPGNPGPDSETHVWISVDYFFDVDAVNVPVLPLTFRSSPGCVTNGWYHDPADAASEKWGRFAFAVTFGPGCEAETLAIANQVSRYIHFDNIQIAAVTVPEPSTWTLVAFGGLILIGSWRPRRAPPTRL